MKKKILSIAILVVLVLLCQFSSCRKPYPACDVKNPLTDLPWLKELTDSYEKGAQPFHVKIYQSTYRDGACFLLDLHVGSPDNYLWVRNCDGETVCYHHYYGDCWGKYNIDFDNKKLIWNKKKKR